MHNFVLLVDIVDHAIIIARNVQIAFQFKKCSLGKSFYLLVYANIPLLYMQMISLTFKLIYCMIILIVFCTGLLNNFVERKVPIYSHASERVKF